MATDCRSRAPADRIGAMSSQPAPLAPHPDRLLPADPALRAIARRLYSTVRDLPIVSPHGHVDPRILLDDEPFRDPAQLEALYRAQFAHFVRVAVAICGDSDRGRDVVQNAFISAIRHRLLGHPAQLRSLVQPRLLGHPLGYCHYVS